MTIRDLIIIPDERLRQICAPVQVIDDSIKTLIKDMFETMYAAPGIGLAAPQIGVMLRLVTMDVASKNEETQPIVLINPELIWQSEERSIYQEGCLSVPDYYEDVERPARCRIRYLDENGQTQEIEAEGLLSTCIQHEIDHLNGVLFIDYISRLKRDRIVTKFKKEARLRTKKMPE